MVTVASHRSPAPTYLDLGSLLAAFPELRIERDLYNINVTSQLGDPLDATAALDVMADHDGAYKPTHLYFHIPLCAYICHFCNYVKKIAPEGETRRQLADQWTDLLIEESRRYLELIPWYSLAHIESLYFGGGTASLIGTRNLARLMAHVRERYTLASDCEITLEGNPDNFQGNEAEEALTHGVNRFSIGVQSLQDEVNEFTGRKHDSAMSLLAVKRLLATRKPFNVDIMFGLPHQTPESVAADIATLAAYHVPTITIYRLRNADRNKMGIGNVAAWNVESVKRKMAEQGVFPSLEETYEMRNRAVGKLLDSGYTPSPCGWWSLPGTYGQTNIPRVSRNKWQRYDSMIAYGPGAYGWLSGDSSAILQTHNRTNIEAHRTLMAGNEGPPLAGARQISGVEAVATILGFAFKSCQPISLERYRRQFGVNLLHDEPYASVLQELCERGFLELATTDDYLLPTLIGEAVHEEIISVYFQQRLGSSSSTSCAVTHV
jgi:coproporphyrinogen III oxidase-like Fe-S oxidoreductase